MIDPFEIHRRHPTHQQRLAAEKQVNVYFVPGTGSGGAPHYAYVVCSALLHDKFVATILEGAIPDFAVVVEAGSGEPGTAVKDKMREYYGFDHEAAESA